MELWRVYSPVVTDSHRSDEEQDPDPNWESGSNLGIRIQMGNPDQNWESGASSSSNKIRKIILLHFLLTALNFYRST